MFLAAVGLFVGSFLVPIWLLTFLGGIYAFTLQAVYTRYPLVAKRYSSPGPAKSARIGPFSCHSYFY